MVEPETEPCATRSAVILAAGKSTRFKSELPKVLHPLCGKPLIQHVLDKLSGLHIEKTIVVLGHESEMVRRALSAYDVECVLQEPQLGTGHAVMCAMPALEGVSGSLLVLYGDVPLIRPETLEHLLESREREGGDAVVLTVDTERPTGYGRIVRNEFGAPVRIVEEKDASDVEKTIREINTGFVCFSLETLRSSLPLLSNANEAGEYYLTDMVAILNDTGARVATSKAASERETAGVNSREELLEAARFLRSAITRKWMREGVTFLEPSSVVIDLDVVIGADTTIYPGVVLEGKTSIGSRCTVFGCCRLENAILADDVTVEQCSVITNSSVGSGAKVGPFAHLRDHARAGPGVRIGNFVEIKKSTLGEGTKAAHLAYLGDAEIGKNVNIGAGAITCNYDGVTKNKTTIEDGAFIGSDSQLIAPVTIHRNAYVAAGSSITEDVPEYALGIARSRQVNKEGWAARKAGKPAGKPRTNKQG